MAKRKEISEDQKELKTKLLQDKVIIGTERVTKALRTGTLSKVFLAKNCPAKATEDLQHFAKLVETPIVILDLDNEELGVFCKKNFFVAVIGIIE